MLARLSKYSTVEQELCCVVQNTGQLASSGWMWTLNFYPDKAKYGLYIMA